MADEPKDIEAIYNAALNKSSRAERSAYLDAACGDDNVLRDRVEALLKANEQAGSFLEIPDPEPNVTIDGPAQIEGPGTKIGRYELLSLIGEGGMGLVYLAEQKEPVKRRLALKIIKPGMDSAQVIARFEAERQALALLDHPNIAHVFDAGTTETGRPYFVMEYVKGMSITRYCDQRKLDVEQRLRLFREVCEGVHHAHQKGIIHRDLKPSNILVSLHGDRAVPKIIDFGIAKAAASSLTEKTMFTLQGQLLGTPEYMSPEQVDLATQDIDTRSDIYSLGVVLYELLAGVLPFERESLEKIGFSELQRTLREQEPASPSVRLSNLGEKAKAIADSRMTQVVPLARRLHRELEWIPLKAMRKDRCRRYRSASEMADDIRNYLNGLPLIAGPETTAYRVKKFVHKHIGSVATVALVAVAIVLGLIISTAMYFRAEQATKKETVARTHAEQAEKVAQEQRKIAQEQAEANRQALYFARVTQAQAVSKYMPVSKTREILESCPEDLRGWEWHYLWHVSNQEILSIKGHDGDIYDIEWSPCGRYFASAGGDDNIARVWDAQTANEILTLHGHDGPVSRVTFSPDGNLLATVNSDKLIRLYEIPTGRNCLTIEGHDNEICCVAFDSSGKQIVSGDDGGIIKVWDTSTGANKVTLGGVDEYVNSIAFRPETNQIVASGKKVVRVWDTATQTEVMAFHGHTWGIRSIAVTPDGMRIASAGEDSMIKVWDANTGKELMTPRS
jgi:serine/threonine protein kinase